MLDSIWKLSNLRGICQSRILSAKACVSISMFAWFGWGLSQLSDWVRAQWIEYEVFSPVDTSIVHVLSQEADSGSTQLRQACWHIVEHCQRPFYYFLYLSDHLSQKDHQTTRGDSFMEYLFWPVLLIPWNFKKSNSHVGSSYWVVPIDSLITFWKQVPKPSNSGWQSQNLSLEQLGHKMYSSITYGL